MNGTASGSNGLYYTKETCLYVKIIFIMKEIGKPGLGQSVFRQRTAYLSQSPAGWKVFEVV